MDRLGVAIKYLNNLLLVLEKNIKTKNQAALFTSLRPPGAWYAVPYDTVASLTSLCNFVM